MKTIARLPTLAEASQLAAFLRASGLPEVQVFEKGDPWAGLLGVDVGVSDEHAERAKALKAEFESSRGDWSGRLPECDFSRLPQGLTVKCPGCGAGLPAAKIAACPACGAGVDIAELIAEQHGPEMLEGCYTGAEDPGPPKDDVPCPGCGYALVGLGERGTCPECGRKFDKARLEAEWDA